MASRSQTYEPHRQRLPVTSISPLGLAPKASAASEDEGEADADADADADAADELDITHPDATCPYPRPSKLMWFFNRKEVMRMLELCDTWHSLHKSSMEIKRAKDHLQRIVDARKKNERSKRVLASEVVESVQTLFARGVTNERTVVQSVEMQTLKMRFNAVHGRIRNALRQEQAYLRIMEKNMRAITILDHRLFLLDELHPLLQSFSELSESVRGELVTFGAMERMVEEADENYEQFMGFNENAEVEEDRLMSVLGKGTEAYAEPTAETEFSRLVREAIAAVAPAAPTPVASTVAAPRVRARNARASAHGKDYETTISDAVADAREAQAQAQANAAKQVTVLPLHPET